MNKVILYKVSYKKYHIKLILYRMNQKNLMNKKKKFYRKNNKQNKNKIKFNKWKMKLKIKYNKAMNKIKN